LFAKNGFEFKIKAVFFFVENSFLLLHIYNPFFQYNITFEEDPITLEKSAQCHDEENSCGRNLCECSVAFAKDMQRVETE
jgi:hypothetical protein